MSRMDGSFKGGKISAVRSRERALERYYASPNICANCDCTIDVGEVDRIADVRKKKFCCQSCAAQFNNRGVTRNPKVLKICKVCGAEYTGKNQHCDECTSKRAWKSSPTLDECKTDRSVKRIILEERGHRCECCGNSE